MAYYSPEDLESMGFMALGKNVRVSTKASIYFPHEMALGDNVRIDDFCTLSGRIQIGRNVHIAVHSNLAGGKCGITVGDFAGLAYGCHLVAQSDDYTGGSMTNPTVPAKFKNEECSPISLGAHVILGTCSIVLPGVTLPEGVSSGAQTLFTTTVEPWGMYVGSPARRVRERSQDVLLVTEKYLREESDQ